MNDTWRLLGRVLAHTGKSLRHITSADLLELREAVHGTGHVLSGHFTVTRLLYHLGIVTEPLLSPSYFRTVRPTVEELVDGFGIRNLEVREAFVLYLKERAPALDFNSLRQLAYRLVKVFWCDLEKHHPEVTSLFIPADVAADWKQRLRLLPTASHGWKSWRYCSTYAPSTSTCCNGRRLDRIYGPNTPARARSEKAI